MALFGDKHGRGSITRRSLIKTGAATGATVAAVGILSGCGKTGADRDDSPEPVNVSEDTGTEILANYTNVDLPYKVANEWSLPLGNVLHPAEGLWIPVTTAGSSANPMVKASALSLSTGKLSEVVPTTLTKSTNAVIYSVACSDSAYAWIELDLVTHAWTLYGSAFSDGALSGDTKMLWQADSNWDPASIGCTGKSVIWQVQPSLSGNQKAQSSHCYLWTVGDSDAQAVVESQGRFATPPTVCRGTVVLTPRVRPEEGTFYGITAYSSDDGLKTRVDQLVMPASIRPFRACYMGDKFVFSVEASYNSGGLLGNMGTYIGKSDSKDFIYLNREPFSCPAGKDGVYIIKSRSSYIVANTKDKTYSAMPSVDRSVDYGEYPARVGECDTFVTFASVKDAKTGYPASVTVRTFSL